MGLHISSHWMAVENMEGNKDEVSLSSNTSALTNLNMALIHCGVIITSEHK
jgi:hypothetical protein